MIVIVLAEESFSDFLTFLDFLHCCVDYHRALRSVWRAASSQSTDRNRLTKSESEKESFNINYKGMERLVKSERRKEGNKVERKQLRNRQKEEEENAGGRKEE